MLMLNTTTRVNESTGGGYLPCHEPELCAAQHKETKGTHLATLEESSNPSMFMKTRDS